MQQPSTLAPSATSEGRLKQLTTDFVESATSSESLKLNLSRNRTLVGVMERLKGIPADRAPRISRCGTPKGVIRPANTNEPGRLMFFNCGRAECARCAEWKQREWAEENVESIVPDISPDDRVLLLTVTVAHKTSTALARSHRVLREALNRLYARAAFKDLCETRITSIELPYNADNGFNPHAHVLLRVRRDAKWSGLTAVEIEQRLRSLWRKITEALDLASWRVHVAEPDASETTKAFVTRQLRYIGKLAGCQPSAENQIAVWEMPPDKLRELVETLHNRQWKPRASGRWAQLKATHQEQREGVKAVLRDSTGPQNVIWLGRLKQMLSMNERAAHLTVDELERWFRDFVVFRRLLFDVQYSRGRWPDNWLEREQSNLIRHYWARRARRSVAVDTSRSGAPPFPRVAKMAAQVD